MINRYNNDYRGVSSIFFFRGRLHFKEGQNFARRAHTNFLPPLPYKDFCPWGITHKREAEHHMITKERLVLVSAPYATFLTRGRNILFQISSWAYLEGATDGHA